GQQVRRRKRTYPNVRTQNLRTPRHANPDMRRPGCSAGPRTVRASPQIVVRAANGPNHAINLWLTEFGGATAIGLRPVAPPSSPHLQVLEATWKFGESSAGREPSRPSGYGGGGAWRRNCGRRLSPWLSVGIRPL